MKILFITNYFYPENFRNNELTVELVKRGNKVKVLTSYPSYPYGKIYDGYGFNVDYEKIYQGVEIERLKSAPRGKTYFGLLNNCISFVRLGKKWVDECDEVYDLVYYPAISPSTSGLVASYYKQKFPSCKMVIHIQDLWPENVEKVLHLNFYPLSKIINSIMNKIYDSSDYILCSSNSFVEHLKRVRNVNEEKLYFWPQFFIEPKKIDYKEPLEYMKFDKNTIKIAFTGNIGYAQGLDILIEAAKYVKERIASHKNKFNVKWFLVGDGRAKKELLQLVKKYNLEDTVYFLGKKSVIESNNYSHFADLSYISFKNNFFDMTIPAKLQGYLACKSPIICVAGGESAKIVNDNKCGFVVNQKNDNFTSSINEKILNCLEKYYNMSNDEKNKLRDNSYKCFNKYFTIDGLLNTFNNIIYK